MLFMLAMMIGVTVSFYYFYYHTPYFYNSLKNVKGYQQEVLNFDGDRKAKGGEFSGDEF